MNAFKYSFQFRYGTIKRTCMDANEARNLLFQFRYGTIKRLFTKTTCSSINQFQFRYGTIKSDYGFHHGINY